MYSPPDFLEYPTPTSPADILSGEFLRVAIQLSRCRGFFDQSVEGCAEILAVGMGYPDASTLQVQAASCENLDMPLPDQERCLMEGIAWRIFLSGAASLGDAMDAIRAIWPASTLSVRTRYDWLGLLISPGKYVYSPAAWPDTLAWSFDHIPSGHLDAVLRNDGQLFLMRRFEYLREIVSAFWTESTDMPIGQLQDEIVRSTWLPLTEAIKQSPTYAAPPGLELVSYYDQQGDLVGHGFFFLETQAYLKQVYPQDGEQLLAAAVALWKREVPPPGMAVMSAILYCDGEFSSPWRSPVVSQNPSLAERRELADIEMVVREPLPVMDGALACGVDFQFGHEQYTRYSNTFKPEEFEGFLGLHLPPQEEIGMEFDWLEPAVPYALDEQTLQTLRQVDCSIMALFESESIWLDTPSSWTQLASLLSATARFARPIIAQGTELQCQGTRGMVAEFEIPCAGLRVASLYPELKGLVSDRLGDYALDYYGKNGIRHDSEPIQREPQFMAYACLRNLGLDPLWAFHGGRQWLGIFCLVRRALGNVILIDSECIEAISEQARILMLKIGKLFSLPDALDQSLGASRFCSTNEGNPEWLEVVVNKMRAYH